MTAVRVKLTVSRLPTVLALASRRTEASSPSPLAGSRYSLPPLLTTKNEPSGDQLGASKWRSRS